MQTMSLHAPGMALLEARSSAARRPSCWAATATTTNNELFTILNITLFITIINYYNYYCYYYYYYYYYFYYYCIDSVLIDSIIYRL